MKGLLQDKVLLYATSSTAGPTTSYDVDGPAEQQVLGSYFFVIYRYDVADHRVILIYDIMI